MSSKISNITAPSADRQQQFAKEDANMNNTKKPGVNDDDAFAVAGGQYAEDHASKAPVFSKLRSWWNGTGNDNSKDKDRVMNDSNTDKSSASSEVLSKAKKNLEQSAAQVKDQVKDHHTRVPGWTPITAKPETEKMPKAVNNASYNNKEFAPDVDVLGFGRGDNGWGNVIEDVDPDYRQYQRDAESTPSSGAYYRPHQEGPHNNWIGIANKYQHEVIQKHSTAHNSGAGKSAMGKDSDVSKDAKKNMEEHSPQEQHFEPKEESHHSEVNQAALLPTLKKAGKAVFGTKQLFGFNNDNALFGNNTSGNGVVNPADGSFEPVNLDDPSLVSEITDDAISKNPSLAQRTMSVGLQGNDHDYSPIVSGRQFGLRKAGNGYDEGSQANNNNRLAEDKPRFNFTRPQNPADLTAFHHSDCASQLEGYEKCLELNGGNYDRCKGSWDQFAMCQQKLKE